MTPTPEDSLIDPQNTMELLARAGDGDDQARDEIFRRYRPALARFLHGRLPYLARGVVDTQDASQEVCTKVFQSLGQFEHRGVGSFWAYLRRAALNYIRDLSRSPGKMRQADRLPEESWAQPAGDSPAPQSELLKKEELEAFDRALQKVPETKRRAVQMRMELDLDYGWIARECGFASPDAARMAITRTLEQIAVEMSRDD